MKVEGNRNEMEGIISDESLTESEKYDKILLALLSKHKSSSSGSLASAPEGEVEENRNPARNDNDDEGPKEVATAASATDPPPCSSLPPPLVPAPSATLTSSFHEGDKKRIMTSKDSTYSTSATSSIKASEGRTLTEGSHGGATSDGVREDIEVMLVRSASSANASGVQIATAASTSSETNLMGGKIEYLDPIKRASNNTNPNLQDGRVSAKRTSEREEVGVNVAEVDANGMPLRKSLDQKGQTEPKKRDEPEKRASYTIFRRDKRAGKKKVAALLKEGDMTAIDDTDNDRVVLSIQIVSCRNLIVADKTSSDPYVKIKLGEKDLHKTKRQMKTLNPVFSKDPRAKSTFRGTLSKKDLKAAGGLTLKVKDWDLVGSNDTLGSVLVPTESILNEGGGKDVEWKLVPPEKQEGVDAGCITIRCTNESFVEATSDDGVAGVPTAVTTVQEAAKEQEAGKKESSSAAPASELKQQPSVGKDGKEEFLSLQGDALAVNKTVSNQTQEVDSLQGEASAANKKESELSNASSHGSSAPSNSNNITIYKATAMAAAAAAVLGRLNPHPFHPNASNNSLVNTNNHSSHIDWCSDDLNLFLTVMQCTSPTAIPQTTDDVSSLTTTVLMDAYGAGESMRLKGLYQEAIDRTWTKLLAWADSTTSAVISSAASSTAAAGADGNAAGGAVVSKGKATEPPATLTYDQVTSLLCLNAILLDALRRFDGGLSSRSLTAKDGDGFDGRDSKLQLPEWIYGYRLVARGSPLMGLKEIKNEKMARQAFIEMSRCSGGNGEGGGEGVVNKGTEEECVTYDQWCDYLERCELNADGSAATMASTTAALPTATASSGCGGSGGLSLSSNNNNPRSRPLMLSNLWLVGRKPPSPTREDQDQNDCEVSQGESLATDKKVSKKTQEVESLQGESSVVKEKASKLTKEPMVSSIRASVGRSFKGSHSGAKKEDIEVGLVRDASSANASGMHIETTTSSSSRTTLIEHKVEGVEQMKRASKDTNRNIKDERGSAEGTNKCDELRADVAKMDAKCMLHSKALDEEGHTEAAKRQKVASAKSKRGDAKLMKEVEASQGEALAAIEKVSKLTQQVESLQEEASQLARSRGVNAKLEDEAHVMQNQAAKGEEEISILEQSLAEKEAELLCEREYHRGAMEKLQRETEQRLEQGAKSAEGLKMQVSTLQDERDAFSMQLRESRDEVAAIQAECDAKAFELDERNETVSNLKQELVELQSVRANTAQELVSVRAIAAGVTTSLKNEITRLTEAKENAEKEHGNALRKYQEQTRMMAKDVETLKKEHLVKVGALETSLKQEEEVAHSLQDELARSRDVNAKLEDEAHVMQNQAAKGKEEVSILEQSLAEKETELLREREHHRGAIEKLQRETEQRLEQGAKTVEGLKRQVSSLQDERDVFSMQLQESRDEVAAMQDKCDAKAFELDERNETVSKLKQELASKDEQVRRGRSEHQVAVQQLHNKALETSEQQKIIENTLDQKLSAFEEERRKLTEHISSLQSDCDSKTLEVVECNESISQLKQDLEAKEEQRRLDHCAHQNTLKQLNEEAAGASKKLKKQIDNLNQQIGALEDDKIKMSGVLKSRLEELEAKHRHQMDKHDQTVAQFEKQLAQKEKEVSMQCDKHKVEMQELCDSISMKNRCEEDLRRRINDLEAEIGTLRVEKESLASTVNEISAKSEALRGQLLGMEDKRSKALVQSLKMDATRLEEDLRVADEATDAASESVSQVKQNLASTEEEAHLDHIAHQATLKNLQEEALFASQQLKKTEDELSQKSVAWQEERNRVAQQIALLKSEREAKSIELEKCIETLWQLKQDLSSKKEQAQLHRNAQQAELQKLREEVSETSEQLQKMENELSQRVTAFEEEKGNLAEQLSSLQLDCDSKDLELTECNDSISQLKQDAIASEKLSRFEHDENQAALKRLSEEASATSDKLKEMACLDGSMLEQPLAREVSDRGGRTTKADRSESGAGAAAHVAMQIPLILLVGFWYHFASLGFKAVLFGSLLLAAGLFCFGARQADHNREDRNGGNTLDATDRSHRVLRRRRLVRAGNLVKEAIFFIVCIELFPLVSMQLPKLLDPLLRPLVGKTSEHLGHVDITGLLDHPKAKAARELQSNETVSVSSSPEMYPDLKHLGIKGLLDKPKAEAARESLSDEMTSVSTSTDVYPGISEEMASVKENYWWCCS